jgi:predicted  nucleic acid-binding Zn-ribbon protein
MGISSYINLIENMNKMHKPIPPIDPIHNKVRDVTSSLRVLEERHSNLRKKSQVIEQNMISSFNKLHDKLKDLQTNFTDLKKSVDKIDDSLNLIMNNLEGYAKVSEVQVIEKYLRLWNPSEYVQRDQLMKILQSKKFK